jgi:hypothetical protein
MKFPAIDFFARTGNFIVAFQVHISKHKDVGPPFLGMCNKSEWLQQNVTVVLIYLSPNEKSQEFVDRPVGSGFIEKMLTRSESDEGIPEGSKKVYLGSRCLAHFPFSLATIPYPDSGR